MSNNSMSNFIAVFVNKDFLEKKIIVNNVK